MRKIKEEDCKLILQTVQEARSYIRYRVQWEMEAALQRLNQLEDNVRIALGEKPTKHVCGHICDDGHADLVKR